MKIPNVKLVLKIFFKGLLLLLTSSAVQAAQSSIETKEDVEIRICPHTLIADSLVAQRQLILTQGYTRDGGNMPQAMLRMITYFKIGGCDLDKDKSICRTHNSNIIAIFTKADTVKILSPWTGQCLHSIWSIHKKDKYSPYAHGHISLSTADTYIRKIWRANYKQPSRLKITDAGGCIAWNSDNSLITIGEGLNVGLWAPYKAMLRAWKDNAAVVDICWQDEQQFAQIITNNTNNMTSIIHIWRIDQKDPLYSLQNSGMVNCIAWHPVAPLLVSGGNDKKLHLWCISSEKNPPTLLKEFSSAVWQVAFTYDGHYLAITDCSGVLEIWDFSDTKQPKCIHSLNFDQFISSISWDHQGQRLAIAIEGPQIKIWDAKSKVLCSTLLKTAKNILKIRFMYNDKLLAAKTFDEALLVWKIEKAKNKASDHPYCLDEIPYFHENEISIADFAWKN